MSAARFFSLSSALAGAALALAGCSESETKFGPPNGLQGKTPSDTAPEDGGRGVGEGGGTGCTKFAGDAGACTTFTNDVFPKLFTTAWTCAAATCHVAGAAAAAGFDLTTADGAYTVLTSQAAKGADGKPYINPACVENDQSFIYKDIAVSKHMPTKIGNNHSPAQQGEIDALAAWIACGSPK